MLGSLRNITEKLERRCSLTEVLIEISVKSYIFLPFCEWGFFLEVWVSILTVAQI